MQEYQPAGVIDVLTTVALISSPKDCLGAAQAWRKVLHCHLELVCCRRAGQVHAVANDRLQPPADDLLRAWSRPDESPSSSCDIPAFMRERRMMAPNDFGSNVEMLRGARLLPEDTQPLFHMLISRECGNPKSLLISTLR